MPRGRPKKHAGAGAGASSLKDTATLEQEEALSSAAALAATATAPTLGSSGRPVRNRIAVRKFGVATESDFLDEPSSLSAAPVDKPKSSQKPAPGQPGNGYVLIHKSFWNDVCSSLGCSSCGKKSVQMKTEKLSGLACKLIMYCTACGVVLSQVTSSPEEDSDPEPAEEPDYEVNQRFVKFFVSEGKTYDDVVIFSKTLGIPCISKAIFDKYRNELLSNS